MPAARFFHVDAFTSRMFTGNPTVVCLMPMDLDDGVYISIAREMNLSVTAFMGVGEAPIPLRWFTPVMETPLCGYATLAAAHLMFGSLGFEGSMVEFATTAGRLCAEKTGDEVAMVFPVNQPQPVDAPRDVLAALGIGEWEDAQNNESNRRLLIRLGSEEEVRALRPNFAALTDLPNPLGWRGVVVTSRGYEYDFVSRHFAPHMGINEDPVTGSTHTVLAPYWAKRLGKSKMSAYQASSRGGELIVELREDRVVLTGRCITVAEGTLHY